MKAKTLTITAIALFIIVHVEAQTDNNIKLYEGTDSVITIHTGGRNAWVVTKDSVIIIRKELLGLEDASKKGKSNKSYKYYKELEELVSFSGKIIEWKHNENFIYNGFLLQSETETRLIKFHPVLGVKIRALEENVEVSGTLAKFKDKGNKVMGLIQIHDNKDTVYRSMNPVFHKVLFDSANAITNSGTIKNIKYYGRWYIGKCILEDNVILNFYPFNKKSFPRNLKVGTTIEYTGTEQQLKPGEVMEGDYKVINCIVVSVNGKKYRQIKGSTGYYVQSEYGMY